MCIPCILAERRAAQPGGGAVRSSLRSPVLRSYHLPLSSSRNMLITVCTVLCLQLIYRSCTGLSPSFKFELSIFCLLVGFRSHRTAPSLARLSTLRCLSQSLPYRMSLKCVIMCDPGLCSIAFLHLFRFPCSFSARSRVAFVLSSGICIEHVRRNTGLLLPTPFRSNLLVFTQAGTDKDVDASLRPTYALRSEDDTRHTHART